MTKIQKTRTTAKQSEKTGTEHTRVRIVELRGKFCLQVDLRFAFTLFYR